VLLPTATDLPTRTARRSRCSRWRKLPAAHPMQRRASTPERSGKIPPAMAAHQNAGADARPPRCGSIAGWRPKLASTPETLCSACCCSELDEAGAAWLRQFAAKRPTPALGPEPKDAAAPKVHQVPVRAGAGARTGGATGDAGRCGGAPNAEASCQPDMSSDHRPTAWRAAMASSLVRGAKHAVK
jgi:hypothetical protein